MKNAESQECRVYRSSKQSETYLYIRADLEPDDLPEALLKGLGKLSEVMSLSLTPQRSLARADSRIVIESLSRDGFYLQLPPKGLLDAKLYWGD